MQFFHPTERDKMKLKCVFNELQVNRDDKKKKPIERIIKQIASKTNHVRII